MKRLPSLLLAVLLLIGISVPTVLAESAAKLQDEAASSAVAESSSAVSSAPQENSGPSAGLLTGQSVQNAAADTAVNSATALHFSDLADVLMKYNDNIRSLQASLGDLSETSTGSLERAVTLLETQSAGIQSTLNALSLAADNPDLDNNQALVYRALIQSLGMNQGSLKSQISTLENQINTLDVTVDTSQNSIQNGINQILKGAETLYIGIVTMESAAGGVQRNIAALDRAAAIREKQLELGMASAYDVETIRYQRSQAQSGLETLKFQIKTSKLSLESMCGMNLSGTVALDALALPTAEELSGVSYDKNWSAAAGRNVDVMNAEVKRNNEKDSDYQSNKKAYQAAVSSFSCKYKILCLTVAEKNRLTESARAAVDYQTRTVAIAKEKYGRGMLSYEEYLTAQDALKRARDDLQSAGLDLFTAYRNYVWATDHGIV